jgi:hypothetical protein
LPSFDNPSSMATCIPRICLIVFWDYGLRAADGLKYHQVGAALPFSHLQQCKKNYGHGKLWCFQGCLSQGCTVKFFCQAMSHVLITGLNSAPQSLDKMD